VTRLFDTLSQGRGYGLRIRSDGISSPLAKTGANATNETACYCDNGALFAPRCRYPLKYLVERRVSGHRAPSNFDQHVTHTTRALAADGASPYGGS